MPVNSEAIIVDEELVARECKVLEHSQQGVSVHQSLHYACPEAVYFVPELPPTITARGTSYLMCRRDGYANEPGCHDFAIWSSNCMTARGLLEIMVALYDCRGY